MDAGRVIQRYISGIRSRNVVESKYKTIMRYISQLSNDLSELTGKQKTDIERSLKNLIDVKYKKLFKEDNTEEVDSNK